MHKDGELLQNVENFALRMVTKRLGIGYQELLDMAALPSSETRSQVYVCCTRLFTTCATFHQTSLHLDLMLVRELHGHDRQLLLHQPFARTNACTHLFLTLSIFGTHYLNLLSQHPCAYLRIMSCSIYS